MVDRCTGDNIVLADWIVFLVQHLIKLATSTSVKKTINHSRICIRVVRGRLARLPTLTLLILHFEYAGYYHAPKMQQLKCRMIKMQKILNTRFQKLSTIQKNSEEIPSSLQYNDVLLSPNMYQVAKNNTWQPCYLAISKIFIQYWSLVYWSHVRHRNGWQKHLADQQFSISFSLYLVLMSLNHPQPPQPLERFFALPSPAANVLRPAIPIASFGI